MFPTTGWLTEYGGERVMEQADQYIDLMVIIFVAIKVDHEEVYNAWITKTVTLHGRHCNFLPSVIRELCFARAFGTKVEVRVMRVC